MTDTANNSTDIPLSQVLYESFNMTELGALCFDLKLPDEEVITDGKWDTIIRLLRYVDRADQDKALLGRLIEYCEELRPGWTWPHPEMINLSVDYDRVRQTRQEQEAISNEFMRTERISVYKKLWALFEPLAKYSSPGPVTYDTAVNLADSMRSWYFENAGGMLLSEDSRAAYFPVKKYLDENILKNDELAKDPQSSLSDEFVRDLRRLGSLLRASMADDIGINRKTFDALEPIPKTNQE